MNHPRLNTQTIAPLLHTSLSTDSIPHPNLLATKMFISKGTASQVCSIRDLQEINQTGHPPDLSTFNLPGNQLLSRNKLTSHHPSRSRMASLKFQDSQSLNNQFTGFHSSLFINSLNLFSILRSQLRSIIDLFNSINLLHSRLFINSLLSLNMNMLNSLSTFNMSSSLNTLSLNMSMFNNSLKCHQVTCWYRSRNLNTMSRKKKSQSTTR